MEPIDEPFLPGDTIRALIDLHDDAGCLMIANELALITACCVDGPQRVLTVERHWQPEAPVQLVWPCMIERVSRDFGWERNREPQ